MPLSSFYDLFFLLEPVLPTFHRITFFIFSVCAVKQSGFKRDFRIVSALVQYSIRPYSVLYLLYQRHTMEMRRPWPC